jgi:hypothetical protein
MYFWHRLFRDHKWKLVRIQSMDYQKGIFADTLVTDAILETLECTICGNRKNRVAR